MLRKERSLRLLYLLQNMGYGLFYGYGKEGSRIAVNNRKQETKEECCSAVWKNAYKGGNEQRNIIPKKL